MVNFRFSSTIQSFGNGGIWVGSCLIVGVGDENQLRWFVVNKMINPRLKLDIIMVGRYCWTCICRLEQVCCEPLNLLGVSFLTCYRVLKLLNLDLLGVSFLTCYQVLKLLNLDLLECPSLLVIESWNCWTWICLECPSLLLKTAFILGDNLGAAWSFLPFMINYFTLLLRSARGSV
jgi:hypothetical protein